MNRSYYAVYHLATALSVEHGDVFANGWNNPSHDPLPGLIKNNGLLTVSERRTLASALEQLRSVREDADYRPGRTVDRLTAFEALVKAETVFNLFELKEVV